MEDLAPQESSTIASDLEPNTCRVKLEKVDGKFGLAYRAEVTGLVVTGILPGYAADTWNHSADADRRICVGDTIVAVNGVEINPDSKNPEEAGCHDMVRAMSRAEGISSFKLLMSGPRWHVSGVTAECIEKMHMATEMGMTLELVTPEVLNLLDDDLIKGSDLRKVTAIQLLMICVMVAIPNALLAGLWSDMGAGFALFSALAPPEMNQTGNAIIFLATMMILGMYLVDWHKWQSRLQQAVVAIIVIYAICLGSIIKCRFYPQAPLVITLLHLPLFVGMLRTTSLKQVERTSFYRGICLSTFLVGLAMLLVWLLWMSVAAWDGGNQYNDATKAKLVKQSATLYQEFKVQVNGRMRSLDYQWDCGDKSNTDFDVVYGMPRENGYTLTVAERADRANACGSVKTIWFLLWVAPFICVMVDLVIAAFCGINGTMVDMDDTSKAEKALKQFVLMVAVLVLGMWVAASVAGASMRLTGTIFAFCGAGLVILFVWMYFEVGAKLVSSTLRQSKIMGTLILVITSDWFRACFLIGFNVLIPTMFMIEVLKQRVRILRKSTPSRTWLTPEATRVLEYLRQWKWLSIFIKANWLVILYWTISIVVAKVTVVFLAWVNEMFQKNVPFLWVLVAFFWIGFTLFLLPPVPGPPMYLIAGIIISAQARDIEAVGYGWGIVIACMLSLVLKLVSGMSQYLIGVFMGKSTKVLQMCQVDQVPIRAMESLLMQKGFAMGKIAVLVGGPDWPISVLSGILRVSLLQVSLGTLPVIFISSPCVLAGAFMAGPRSNMTEADKSMWDALANTALAVSAVVQMASGVFAMYYVQDEISKHAEELAKPRPEHEKVRLLTLAEKDYNVCYAEALEAKTMPRFWVGLSWVSVCLMLICLFVFQFMDEACFRSFAIQDKISDPEGLNCSSLGCALVRLVRSDPPVGWGALGLFFFACVLHFVFLKYVDLRARRLLAQKRASGELGLRGTDSAAAAAT